MTNANEITDARIEVEEDSINFTFYRTDGCICAMGSAFFDGHATIYIFNGPKCITQESMTAEAIKEAIKDAQENKE